MVAGDPSVGLSGLSGQRSSANTWTFSNFSLRIVETTAEDRFG
jgi:hypothetical protein